MFFHYAKFSLFHALTLATVAAMLFGQHWIPIGYAAFTAFIVFGDALLGDDKSIPTYRKPNLLTLQLYLALPLLFLLLFVSLWSLGENDVLGFGQWMSTQVNYDFINARQQTESWQLIVGVFFVGLMVSSIGTITGHELVHRTWDKTSLIIGRWLLAFSFDSNFSIEHVYGHHKHVATEKDPATAPRGRSVYAHIVISTWKGNISAWNIEKQRLNRKKLPIFSYNNTCLRGYIMSLSLVLCAFLIAGFKGVAFFIAVGLWAKVMLEITNYMEHYGLVRSETSKVEPKHSWNTNKKISSWAMFNLSRHSHHHAQGQLPFHQLKPYPEAPQMVSGYLATILLTLVPPLWFKLMAPRLAHWDQNFANDEEREIIARKENK